MQAINEAGADPLFMAAVRDRAAQLGGSRRGRRCGKPGPLQMLVAGGVSISSRMVRDRAYHVPHNDTLASVDANGTWCSDFFVSLCGPWTAWNHVRTLTSLAAAAAYDE